MSFLVLVQFVRALITMTSSKRIKIAVLRVGSAQAEKTSYKSPVSYSRISSGDVTLQQTYYPVTATVKKRDCEVLNTLWYGRFQLNFVSFVSMAFFRLSCASWRNGVTQPMCKICHSLIAGSL